MAAPASASALRVRDTKASTAFADISRPNSDRATSIAVFEDYAARATHQQGKQATLTEAQIDPFALAPRLTIALIELEIAFTQDWPCNSVGRLSKARTRANSSA